MSGWYELSKTPTGQFHFVLKAGNHQIIGTSQMYNSPAARDGGIASVKQNGASATVKTID